MQPLSLFRYNWQVREEWFQKLREISPEELGRQRTGGLGSIAKTLNHIVDAEQGWFSHLADYPEVRHPYEDYSSLQAIEQLSAQYRPAIENFLTSWGPDSGSLRLEGVRPNGLQYSFSYDEVVFHLVAHEIHHIGQISIWGRELGIEPVSANVIFRGLF